MTASTLLGRYWRILLVGVLGGLIAFTGSFLVEPTYTSSTRMLIHGRDATFLTSTAQDLSTQPGVVDSTLAKTLASTYAGLATSRSVAVAVVDRLDLDAPPAGGRSLLGTLSHGLATAYRCGKAFVKSGFCATPSRHEAAVLGVQQGVSAAQAGANAGEAAGQQGSYVLEVSGSGTTRDQAKAVTDAIADELVAQSSQRFTTDAQRHVEDLQRQVDAAAEGLRTKTAAVATFKNAHGITAADEQQVLLATSASNLRAELNRAEADRADTQAQLASVERSLASTPADATSQQRITTGRSTTVLDTTADSQVYDELLSKQKSLKAQLTGLSARAQALRRQVNSAQPLSLNTAQAELAAMQQDVEVARANQTKLASDLQAAQSNALSRTQDLSRIDEADTPTYPTAPKRYVYLALGLLLGGLAGAGLTWLARRRDDDLDAAAEPEDDADLHEVLMHRAEPSASEPSEMSEPSEPVTVPEARSAGTGVVVLPPDQLTTDGSSNGHAGAKHP